MRRVLVGAGTLVMGYAIIGVVLDAEVNKVGVALFVATVVIAHDGIVLPLLIAAGAVVPRGVQVAGLIGTPVLLVGLPLAVGAGRAPDNPSALPLAYPRNLLVVLALVCGTALVVRSVRKGLERAGRHWSQ
jgi:hypothetical protein